MIKYLFLFICTQVFADDSFLINHLDNTTNVVQSTKHYYGVHRRTGYLIYLGIDSPGLYTGQKANEIQALYSVIYMTNSRILDEVSVAWKPTVAGPPSPSWVKDNTPHYQMTNVILSLTNYVQK